MRKKKRIKNILMLIVIVLAGVFVFTLYKSDNNSEGKEEKEENDLYNELITENFESDSEVISRSLSDGMNEEDFKSVFDKKTKIVTTDKSYKSLNYNFDKQLSYAEIEEYLYNLSASDIVVLEEIGRSVDNRVIYGIEVGLGKKALFIDGNIHAAEVGGTLFILKFLNDLVDDYENGDSEAIELLNNHKVVAIPSINPDGYEYINYGVEAIKNKDLWIYKNKDDVDPKNSKFNANGVDLNRNFPTQNSALLFEGEKLISSVSLTKTTSLGTYYGGESMGSESETRAFMYYFTKHYKNIHTYINIHSQGRVLYAGKPNLTDEFNELCKSTASLIHDITNYKVHGLEAEEVGEGNDGSVTDFAAELANGFKYSTKTGRLSTDKHINNSAELKYEYSVITLETLNKYTTDPNVFKEEWIYRNFEEMFKSLMKNDY